MKRKTWNEALIEGAGMARRLAHECRREGNVSEFLRHIKRARTYVRDAHENIRWAKQYEHPAA